MFLMTILVVFVAILVCILGLLLVVAAFSNKSSFVGAALILAGILSISIVIAGVSTCVVDTVKVLVCK